MAAKRGEGISSGSRGRRNKRKGFTYKTYIMKVLRDVDTRTGINAKAMVIMNNFMEDMFGRIAAEAARLSRYNGKRTLTAREIQTAVRFVLPGELGKFATSEGAKAVTKFSTSRN